MALVGKKEELEPLGPRGPFSPNLRRFWATVRLAILDDYWRFLTTRDLDLDLDLDLRFFESLNL